MPPEHLSDLRWRLAANVVPATFKFGDRRTFEFFQRFLARNISHRDELTRLKFISELAAEMGALS